MGIITTTWDQKDKNVCSTFSDGQVERQHQTILNSLTKFVTENQRDWDRWIPMYLLAYRSSEHKTIGVTPAELYFTQDLRLPIFRGNPPVSEEQ